MSLLCVDAGTKSVRLTGKKKQVKETKKRVNDILTKEKEVSGSSEYIKQKKGVTDYLLHLAEKQEVQFPPYWKAGQRSHDLVVKEELASQSELYKEVEKMIVGTWEPLKAGQGKDAHGLNAATKLVVKRIFLIKNLKLFPQYDAMRKGICRQAAVNKFPCLNGLQGEWEVKTRTLGMPSRLPSSSSSSLSSSKNFVKSLYTKNASAT